MNLNDTQQRVRTTTVVVLVGLTLLFLILDSTGNLNNAFAFLQNPLAVMMDWTAARADTFAEAFSGPRDMAQAEQQIQTLEARIADLERENAQLREQQQEYQLYVELFNRASDTPQFERVTANVIGRDTSPVFRSVIIDKGTNDGIAPGMPVEGTRGLVGQVFRASPRAAQVLLITDNVSSIPSRLSASRATGMVFGNGSDSSLVMDWINLEAQVEVGELVFTSGGGGQFPQDLVIGEVVSVERTDADILQRAILQPAEQLDDLEMVFIITNFEPIDTTVFDSPPEELTQP